MRLKSLVFSISMAGLVSLPGCVFSLKHGGTYDTSNLLLFSGLVSTSKYPIKISCHDEARKESIVLASDVRPATTPVLKSGTASAYQFTAAISVPEVCRDDYWFGSSGYKTQLTTLEAVIQVTTPNGQQYETPQGIYFIGDQDDVCAVREYGRRQKPGDIVKAGCYLKRMDGTKATAMVINNGQTYVPAN